MIVLQGSAGAPAVTLSLASGKAVALGAAAEDATATEASGFAWPLAPLALPPAGVVVFSRWVVACAGVGVRSVVALAVAIAATGMSAEAAKTVDGTAPGVGAVSGPAVEWWVVIAGAVVAVVALADAGGAAVVPVLMLVDVGGAAKPAFRLATVWALQPLGEPWFRHPPPQETRAMAALQYDLKFV